MILHFLTDDKFGNYVLSQFDSEEMDSKFIVINESDSLEHITYNGPLFVTHPGSAEFDQVILRLSEYRAIILHGLFWPWEETVLKYVPPGVKVAWVFWGGEIYGRKDIQSSFLAPRTRNAFRWQMLKRTLRNGGKLQPKYEIPIDFFKRIDYCLTDIPNEFIFARDYVGNKMTHLWYNYYSIEETLGNAFSSRIIGKNILIGNCGSVEGNHLDVFSLLNKRKIEDRDIIIPLSYGDPWFIKRITNKARNQFREAFHPITNFLPRNTYNQLLSTCSGVIMNHHRPQALGNIITSLWLGARVYMSEMSIQYKYLKQQGLLLFSIENDLLQREANAFDELSDKEREHNRSILYSIYSQEATTNKIKDLIKHLD